jgi:phosphoglycolate phosphatase-like HAD superfamily hydrolase
VSINVQGDRQKARRCRAVLFDWDGTIVDSLQGMFDAMRYAYQRYTGRLFPRDLEEFRRVSPMRLTESTALYAGEHAAEVAAAYKWYYTQEGYKSTKLYPGIREVLGELRRRGYALGVVTNTGPERLGSDLRHLELEGLLDVMITAADTAERKPHPAPLLKGHAQLIAAGLLEPETGPGELAYVGDYPGDIAAARAAGMLAVAALWGGIFPVESLLAEGPDCCAADPRELLQIFP